MFSELGMLIVDIYWFRVLKMEGNISIVDDAAFNDGQVNILHLSNMEKAELKSKIAFDLY